LQSAKERLSKLKEQAQGEAAQLAQQAELRLALTHLQDFAAQIEQGLDRADWSTRRQVIRALVKRVEIVAKEVRIVYRVAPVPFVERPLEGGVLQHCPNRCRALQCNAGGSAAMQSCNVQRLEAHRCFVAFLIDWCQEEQL
jgi:hypothetical protein